METDFKKELEKAANGISANSSDDLDELAFEFLRLGISYGASRKPENLNCASKRRKGPLLG